jgi:hypothetical protein
VVNENAEYLRKLTQIPDELGDHSSLGELK